MTREASSVLPKGELTVAKRTVLLTLTIICSEPRMPWVPMPLSRKPWKLQHRNGTGLGSASSMSRGSGGTTHHDMTCAGNKADHMAEHPLLGCRAKRVANAHGKWSGPRAGAALTCNSVQYVLISLTVSGSFGRMVVLVEV